MEGDLPKRLRELKRTQVLNHTAADWIDEAARELERLVEVLAEAHQAFADQIEADLDFCCPKRPDGTPDEDEMDEASRPMIEATRALLARIEAVLPAPPASGTVQAPAPVKALPPACDPPGDRHG